MHTVRGNEDCAERKEVRLAMVGFPGAGKFWENGEVKIVAESGYRTCYVGWKRKETDFFRIKEGV